MENLLIQESISYLSFENKMAFYFCFQTSGPYNLTNESFKITYYIHNDLKLEYTSVSPFTTEYDSQ